MSCIGIILKDGLALTPAWYISLQLHHVLVFRDADVPAQFFIDDVFECEGTALFAVGEEELFGWCFAAGEPAKEVVAVAVGA